MSDTELYCGHTSKYPSGTARATIYFVGNMMYG